MSANALPVITVHGHASNPGTVTEPTVYEQALARSLSPESLPAHIGVLVDGNRRWAAQRGLSTCEATPPVRSELLIFWPGVLSCRFRR